MLATAAATLAIATLGAVAPAEPTHAADEIAWFEAAPGIYRTELHARRVAYDRVNDLILAVSDRGDGGPRVITIERSTLRVIAQRSIPPLPRALDIDVSRDGRTAFVFFPPESYGVPGEMRSYRLPDLEAVDRIAIPDSWGYRRVVASPDEPSRFALVGSSGSRRVRVFDAGDELDLTGFEPIGNLAFGASSDVFYVADDEISRFEIGDTIQLIRSVSQGSSVYDDTNGRSAMFLAPSGLVQVQTQGDQGVTIRDPDTLAVRDRRSIATEAPIAYDPESGRLLDQSESTLVIDVLDLDNAPTRIRLPFVEFPDDVFGAAMMPDGFAVLEVDPERLGGWMTIVADDLLASPSGDFHPMSPARLLDTRAAIGSPTRPVGEAESRRVQVTGVGEVPRDGVLAAVLNVTVTNPTRPSFLSLSPAGLPRPDVSNINFLPGQTLANAATVLLGENGQVDLFNRWGSTDVVIDIVGYYADVDGTPGTRYVPAESERIADTRERFGDRLAGPLGPGESMTIKAPLDWRGSPTADVAATFNVTVVGATAPSFLTVYPAGESRPDTSSLNFGPGDVRANLVVSKISLDDEITIYNHAGSVHVIVDYFGRYSPTDPAIQTGRFFPVVPFRAIDTREASPYPAPGHVPPSSLLIGRNSAGYTDIINLTAASTTANGFLAVAGWSDLESFAFPRTSNVNFFAGEVVSNAAYATGAPDNAIVNPFGNTHVIVDVFGYLTPSRLRPIEDVWVEP